MYRSRRLTRIVKSFILASFLAGFFAIGGAAQSVGENVDCGLECHDHGQSVFDLTGSKKRAWAAENACVVAFCG